MLFYIARHLARILEIAVAVVLTLAIIVIATAVWLPVLR
jgi:hypothetical protein